MTEYDVYIDEDGFYYSEGVLAENGDYYMINFPTIRGQKWAVVMPLDLCTVACKKVGWIKVEE